MDKPQDGIPVFPQHGWSSNPETVARMGYKQGMSLRDWFAGMALQGLLASGHFTNPPEDSGDQAWMTTHEDPFDDETGEKIHIGRRRFDFPEAAWKCADAVLAARGKEVAS